MKTLRITFSSFLLLTIIGMSTAEAQIINPDPWRPKSFWIERAQSLMDAHTIRIEDWLKIKQFSNHRATLYSQMLAEDWDGAVKTAETYIQASYQFFQNIYKKNDFPDGTWHGMLDNAIRWLGYADRSGQPNNYLSLYGALVILRDWPD